MAKKKNNSDNSIKDINALNKITKGIFSVINSNYKDQTILDNNNNRFRTILDNELNLSKGVAGGSIIDFVSSLKQTNSNTKSTNRGANLQPDSNEVFTKNINDIFGYFQDMYRNKFLEMSDLKFISKFIPSMGEAVKTTLDSIVTSDNIAETIDRKIVFDNSISEEQQDVIINEIKHIEKEAKLLKKLKNTVYKKTLITGSFFVYAPSYQKIFQEYQNIKNKQTSKNPKGSFSNAKVTNEAMYTCGDIDISPAMENVASMLTSLPKINGAGKISNNEAKNIITHTMDSMPIITCNNSDVLMSAVESAEVIIKNGYEKYFHSDKKTDDLQKNINKVSDGTMSIDKVSENSFDVPGTYIKYVDSKNIIPINILGHRIGYFLIHPTFKKDRLSNRSNSSGITSIGSSLFNSVNITENKKNEAIATIVDSITEGIINNFSEKFVVNNLEYKKLIGDCIVANGLTDTDYNIQFIPEEDVIEFKINENEDEQGESMLSDSLFPAKALLSMLVCRLLNYINKSGNKQIAHIYKGPVDAYATNQINRVIQDLQDQNVTFNDLLSPNLVFSKFNRDGNIAMPTSKNGSHLVEFETQEGQQIDTNPDMEEKLEKMAIMGSGVPTTVIDPDNSADFAKQVVSTQIKYAGRVATLQSDLEEPTTMLYRILLHNSTLPPELKTAVATGLQIKLPRPKVLVNGNNGEFMRTIIETAQSIAETYVGQTGKLSNVKDFDVIKEAMIKEIVKENSPYFDWDKLDSMFEGAVAKYANKPKKTDNKDGSDNLDSDL